MGDHTELNTVRLEEALSELSASLSRRITSPVDCAELGGAEVEVSESKWSDEHDDTLLRWKQECVYHSRNHFHLACFYRYLHIFVSFPAIVLPATCSQLNKLNSARYAYFVEPLLLLGTCCSVVISVFNFGRRSLLHFHVDQQLTKMIQEADVELRKPRGVRQPSEHYLVVAMFKIENVLANAPGDGCASSITRFLTLVWKCFKRRS